MKKLYLMRHAKSDWSGYYVSDFERTLNKRGKRDAPMMGEVLKTKISPDLIVSSPAVRAKLTAEAVAEKLGYNPRNIRFEEDIYEASALELLRMIQSLPDDAQEVLLIGHNPGLTDLINHLGNVRLDNLPTASLVGFAFDVTHWQEIKPGTGSYLFFEYPKKYKN